MKIKNQLEQIAKSYDRHFFEHGREDALSYDNLPDYITSNPDYSYKKKEQESDWEEVRRKKLLEFLSPAPDMNFIHLGCSLSLRFKGYDKWPSTYYGVDISRETILHLYEYVAKNRLPIGSLYCGSVHETPFAESYFDIGDCVGVLEYFERDFVLKSIKEFHRIIKPGGKLVVDIPNTTSPSGRVMMMVEEYMGRPDKFNMLPHEFEDMISDYFEIVDSDRIRAESCGESYMGSMYYYYLICKK